MHVYTYKMKHWKKDNYWMFQFSNFTKPSFCIMRVHTSSGLTGDLWHLVRHTHWWALDIMHQRPFGHATKSWRLAHQHPLAASMPYRMSIPGYRSSHPWMQRVSLHGARVSLHTSKVSLSVSGESCHGSMLNCDGSMESNLYSKVGFYGSKSKTPW